MWAKLAVSCPATASATPAAYRQRTSKANRSAASRSLNPSRRCRTMTTARIDGGPSADRWAGTGQQTARAGTAGPAPGPRTGTPTPQAELPHTSGHQRWAAPAGAADGQGSRQVLRVRQQGRPESASSASHGRIQGLGIVPFCLVGDGRVWVRLSGHGPGGSNRNAVPSQEVAIRAVTRLLASGARTPNAAVKTLAALDRADNRVSKSLRAWCQSRDGNPFSGTG